MTTNAALSKLEREALLAALERHKNGRPYFWKCKSMNKLVARGLAERWIVTGEPNGWTLTPEGVRVARALLEGR